MKLLKHSKAAPSRAGFILNLILFIVTTVAIALLTPRPEVENQKPAVLSDFDFPTATPGRPQPLLWGRQRVKAPNVIWYGDFAAVPLTEEIDGGWFHSDETVITGYQYFVGMQMGLCRGQHSSEVGQVRMHGVWIGDDRVFDGTVSHLGEVTISRPCLFGGNDTGGQGGVEATFVFYDGREDQPASGYLAPKQTLNSQTPAYRGLAYIAPKEVPWYIGNTTQIKPWTFELSRYPNQLGAATPQIGDDANPACVIYEILTDPDWGRGIPTSRIDVTNFQAVAATLATEGNGFSLMIETAKRSRQIIDQVLDQIDGALYEDHDTGKFTLALARDDYVIASLPLVDKSNSKMKSYDRATWKGTPNVVKVEFANRDNDYVTDYGLAQDSANIKIQGNQVYSVTKRFSGVKDPTLAASLAWRELRALSFPLAKIELELNRSFYGLRILDLFRYTGTIGTVTITDAPFRILDIDYGALERGVIRVSAIQDVFSILEPSFAEPFATLWVPPEEDTSLTVVPYATDRQYIFEGTRKMSNLATGSPLALVDTNPEHIVFAGARRTGTETRYRIRHTKATQPTAPPTTDFSNAGSVSSFCLIGELADPLGIGGSVPITSLLVTPQPDAVSTIKGALKKAALDDMGTDLRNLIMVGDPTDEDTVEFMLVQDSSDGAGGTVSLDNVYRGIMDTPQRSHTTGTAVWIVRAGQGPTASSNTNVRVRLQPYNAQGEVNVEGAWAGNDVVVNMSQRINRPYPPARISLNGAAWDQTNIDFEHTGSDETDYGFDVGVLRRNYQTTGSYLGDEIAALTTDDSSVTTLNTPNGFRISVIEDPDVLDNIIIGNGGFFTALEYASMPATMNILRKTILTANDGVVPSTLRIEIEAFHTISSTEYTSRNKATLTFTVDSALDGLITYGRPGAGGTATGAPSDLDGYTDYDLRVDDGSSGVTGLSIQYRLNGGGSWLDAITSGSATGSIAGVLVSDTLEFRWLDNGSAVPSDTNVQITIADNASSTDRAFFMVYKA